MCIAVCIVVCIVVCIAVCIVVCIAVCIVVCIAVCIVCIVVCIAVCIVVCIVVCIAVCIAVSTLYVGLPARSQYSEGPATGHLDTGFSRFPCDYKQTLRRFRTFQVATTCFSCSPPDLNILVVTDFMYCLHVK